MGYKILKVIVFLISLFPVFCFGVATYLGFSGKAPWGFWESIGFLLGTLVFLYMAIKLPSTIAVPLSKKQKEALKTEGQKIMTEFKAMDRRWNLEINGQSPLVIFTQDAYGNVYHSEDLWFWGGEESLFNDPRFQAWQQLQRIDVTKKYLIPVYKNPFKPAEYYLDLAGLQIE